MKTSIHYKNENGIFYPQFAPIVEQPETRPILKYGYLRGEYVKNHKEQLYYGVENDRDVEETSSGYAGEIGRDDEGIDGEDVESRPRAGQEQIPDGVGTAHEHDPSPSGGNTVR